MKEVLTVLGTVDINRAYYYYRQGGSGICPKDKALDIEGTSSSLTSAALTRKYVTGE